MNTFNDDNIYTFDIRLVSKPLVYDVLTFYICKSNNGVIFSSDFVIRIDDEFNVKLKQKCWNNYISDSFTEYLIEYCQKYLKLIVFK